MGAPVTMEQRLLQSALVTEEQLQQARQRGVRLGTSLVQALLDGRFVSQADMGRFLAEFAEVEFVEVDKTSMSPDTEGWVTAITPETCRKHSILPFQRDGQGLVVVAMFDPMEVEARNAINLALGNRWRAVAATFTGIQAALDRLTRGNMDISGTITQVMELAPPPSATATVASLEVQDEAPTINLVNQLIAKAVELGASDIHFQPSESSLKVRMRIDGVLQEKHSIPREGQSGIVTRLKIMAEMNMTETRIPQDGRFSVKVMHRPITLRVSTLPTQHGESVVLRILDADESVQSLGDLGLEAGFHRGLLEVMDSAHGVVIVTGPTGSGKTTTLYAMLKHLNTPEYSIFTLEDPVEIPMPGIRQTQVREEIDLTFQKCLRSLLRQDPDIILVGETRDRETADLMIRAALTGHLVFTTLHTNDAPGAIPRLIDMGVEPYLLPSSLVAVLAQRLVRRLCPRCRRPVMDPAAHFRGLGLVAPAPADATIQEAVGCPDCLHAGYRRRQAIFEMMRMQENLHEPIMRRAAHSEFLQRARGAGMRTLFEDGLRHVLSGLTSLTELLRVVRPSHFVHDGPG